MLVIIIIVSVKKKLINKIIVIIITTFWTNNHSSFDFNFLVFNPWELYTQGYTRCSAIAERPRCRVRYSFRQK